METISVLLALCVGNSSVTGEFPTQRPVTRCFDGFSDLRLNKRLSKQSWGWWFETPSWSLWRQYNDDKPADRYFLKLSCLSQVVFYLWYAYIWQKMDTVREHLKKARISTKSCIPYGNNCTRRDGLQRWVATEHLLKFFTHDKSMWQFDITESPFF